MRNHDESLNLKFDNISLDGKVGFIENGHKYVCLEDPNLKFTSVTTLLGRYAEKFDAERIAREQVEKLGSKYYGMDWKEVALGWADYGAECASNGTNLHTYGENLLNGKKDCEVPDNPKAKWVSKAVQDIIDRGYEIATTEMLVYSKDLSIAGQSDIILKKRKYNSTEYDFQIFDWKFLSKPLTKKSFFSRKTGYKCMLGPFKHLMDCNWIHYSIQLALYQTLTGEPERVTEKVLVVVQDDHYDLIPAYPMRVFWDQNNELQCVHEIWNGRWWDSRMQQLYSKKPKDIVGI